MYPDESHEKITSCSKIIQYRLASLYDPLFKLWFMEMDENI